MVLKRIVLMSVTVLVKYTIDVEIITIIKITR